MKLIAASHYREGSISAIGRSANQAGSLMSFYSTVNSASLGRIFGHFPVMGHRVNQELSRRGLHGIDGDLIRSAAITPELLRVLARRALSTRTSIPTRLLYWVKTRFDAAVAKDLPLAAPDVFVGMWGSSLRSFRSAGKHCLKVLNYVNSRPRDHNLYLREYANLRADHQEMVPAATSDTVEQEMDVADLILVPSHFVASQMPEYGSKVAIIPYGVDAAQFVPGPRDPALSCNVLYLGQISHRKGIKTLLAAAKRLPMLDFLLAGPLVSPEVLNGLPPNARYVKGVHPSRVPQLMRSADVFVLPSFEDSFGLVAAEAMASGVPTVVSSHCGSAELLLRGGMGSVFQVGEIDQLVSQIEHFARSEAVRGVAGREAREQVVRSHTWRQYGDEVLSSIASAQRSAALVSLLDPPIAL